MSFQGMASNERIYQHYIDAIGDAYLLGYHCHLNENCNLAEANAAKVTWQLTNKLLVPHGFAVNNRVSDRLYQLKRMIGNFRTMARSKGDALFNMMYILCEEELWQILAEKGINYLGVGGFSHFSYYSDLSWMGLVLDLCESLKFAGHAKLVEAIRNGLVNEKVIKPLHAFRNEYLYTITPYGQRLLFDLKEEVFAEPSFYKGERIDSFREDCSRFADEFDNLLRKIGQRFEEEHLLVKIAQNPIDLPAKLWRLTLEWEKLHSEDREKLQAKAFVICQEEIKKSGFEPLVWLPSKRIARRVDEEIASFEEFSYLFEGREQELMKGKDCKVRQLSLSVYSFSKQFEELNIKWIS